MKTAIYIDQDLFNEAETFSYAADVSRSKLYCTAISEYLENHAPGSITENYNNYYAGRDSKLDADLKDAANRLFAKEDW